MNKLILSLTFLVFTQFISAQTVVNYEKLSTVTKVDMLGIFPFFNYITDVDVYRVEYESPDVHGNLDTLSGLITLPVDTIDIYPKVAYMHGTVDSRDDVPSQLSAEANIVYLMGGLGYAAVAPDYPGLGTGRGFHPYVHARSEAQSGIDLITAMEEIAELEGRLLNDQLFITGYSQGGHGAMAMQKLVEEEYAAEYTVTASAPMSGPYSISGVMFDFVLDGNEYGTPAYLPNVVLSMQTAYGNIYNDLGEVFKPEYVAEILRYYNEEIGLFDLNDFLYAELINNEGAPIALKLFNDDFITDLTNDVDHPFYAALRDNDLYDWTPDVPTRMMYCTGDDQVSYLNSIIADSTMNANGAANVDAIEVGGIDQDHGDCFVPALLQTKTFFDGFQEILSGVNAPSLTAINIYPNPAQDFIQFDIPVDIAVEKVRLTNVLGATEGFYELNGNSLNISSWSKGMKILEFMDKDGLLIGVEKVLVK